MVIPRHLGGLEVDPLTYLYAVELLAEGAGSVGWNLGNGGVGQLVTLGFSPVGLLCATTRRCRTQLAGPMPFSTPGAPTAAQWIPAYASASRLAASASSGLARL
jgi:hypothetical protein